MSIFKNGVTIQTLTVLRSLQAADSTRVSPKARGRASRIHWTIFYHL